MTPFWRFQILTTIRLTLARSGLCLDRGRDRICGHERVHDRGRRHVHVRDLGCRLAINVHSHMDFEPQVGHCFVTTYTLASFESSRL